ncbi:MAG: hypothetical protein J0I09_01025 [Sphingobacteriia bacterium]|nr:hypothetical protein [Sphingobacteriia bacterium]
MKKIILLAVVSIAMVTAKSQVSIGVNLGFGYPYRYYRPMYPLSTVMIAPPPVVVAQPPAPQVLPPDAVAAPVPQVAPNIIVQPQVVIGAPVIAYPYYAPVVIRPRYYYPHYRRGRW